MFQNLTRAIAGCNNQGDALLETLLVEEKITPDFCDASGKTLLHWASSEGRVDTMKILVSYGANMELFDRKNGFNALHFAAKHCQPRSLDYLLQNGMDWRTRTEIMETSCLHLVASVFPPDANCRESARNLLLASHGEAAHLENFAGETPLHAAAASNNVTVALLLMKYGFRTTQYVNSAKLEYLLKSTRDNVVGVNLPQYDAIYIARSMSNHLMLKYLLEMKKKLSKAVYSYRDL